MSVVTTRRLDELQAQCDSLDIAWTLEDGREDLMDKLRQAIGSFDKDTEIDPMKAKDLKHEIKWSHTVAEGKYAGIAQYLTDKWVAEPKLDGARMRMFMGTTGNTLNTGRRSVKTFAYTDRTANFPHLAGLVLPSFAGTVLDGELIAPSAKIQTHTGLWTDSLLNASVALCNSNPAGSVATQARFGKAQFWVFDVMLLNGSPLYGVSYQERRVVLERIVEAIKENYPDTTIVLVPQLPATTQSIESSLEAGFEGVMLKSLTGPYQPGKRSSHWLKVKAFSSADAFVVGYADGLSGNKGLVGSLDLAVFDRWLTEEEIEDPLSHEALPMFCFPNGSVAKVRAVAQVGNLTQEMRVAISAEDGSLKPEFYGTVIEFQAQGLGKNGRARHAHMTRLRPDKSAEDCGLDQLDVFPRV